MKLLTCQTSYHSNTVTSPISALIFETLTVAKMTYTHSCSWKPKSCNWVWQRFAQEGFKVGTEYH